MFLFFGGGDGLGWMEENKKSGGGDVRAEALAWDDEWDKPKNVFFGFIPIRRLTKGLQPSHPRLPTFCSFPSIPSHLLHQKKGTFPIGIAFSAHHH